MAHIKRKTALRRFSFRFYSNPQARERLTPTIIHESRAGVKKEAEKI